MEEIQDASKEIDFNNLTYQYKGNAALKSFIVFKSTLNFYKSIKEGYITLEKAEEKQSKFKSEINDIEKGSKKSEDKNKCNKKY